MLYFFQQVLNGLHSGALYALLAFVVAGIAAGTERNGGNQCSADNDRAGKTSKHP